MVLFIFKNIVIYSLVQREGLRIKQITTTRFFAIRV